MQVASDTNVVLNDPKCIKPPNRIGLRRRIVTLSAMLWILGLGLAPPLWAQQVFTWTGAMDADWLTVANWEVGGATATMLPGTPDSVMIPSGTSNNPDIIKTMTGALSIEIAAMTMDQGTTLTVENRSTADDIDLVIGGQAMIGGTIQIANMSGTTDINVDFNAPTTFATTSQLSMTTVVNARVIVRINASADIMGTIDIINFGSRFIVTDSPVTPDPTANVRFGNGARVTLMTGGRLILGRRDRNVQFLSGSQMIVFQPEMDTAVRLLGGTITFEDGAQFTANGTSADLLQGHLIVIGANVTLLANNQNFGILNIGFINRMVNMDINGAMTFDALRLVSSDPATGDTSTLTLNNGAHLNVTNDVVLQSNSTGDVNMIVLDGNAVLDVEGNVMDATNDGIDGIRFATGAREAQLRIAGNLDLQANNILFDAIGTVIFDGITMSEITTAQIFPNLHITTPNKEVRFSAGARFVVEGAFRAGGQPNAPIHLRSTMNNPGVGVPIATDIDPRHWLIDISDATDVMVTNALVALSASVEDVGGVIQPYTLFVDSGFRTESRDWNLNWRSKVPVSSRTVDGNENGLLDRIAVSFEDGLMIQNDTDVATFENIEVTVSGYEVITIDNCGTSNQEFCINLEEKQRFDTAETPRWSIDANSSLNLVGLGGTGNNSVPASPGAGEANDNASPVLGYMLTAAGRNQIFVRFSEPVFLNSGPRLNRTAFTNLVSSGGFNGQSPISSTIVSPINGGTQEILLNMGTTASADDVIDGTINVATDIVDGSSNVIVGTLDNVPIGVIGIGTPENTVIEPILARRDSLDSASHPARFFRRRDAHSRIRHHSAGTTKQSEHWRQSDNGHRGRHSRGEQIQRSVGADSNPRLDSRILYGGFNQSKGK